MNKGDFTIPWNQSDPHAPLDIFENDNSDHFDRIATALERIARAFEVYNEDARKI